MNKPVDDELIASKSISSRQISHSSSNCKTFSNQNTISLRRCRSSRNTFNTGNTITSYFCSSYCTLCMCVFLVHSPKRTRKKKKYIKQKIGSRALGLIWSKKKIEMKKNQRSFFILILVTKLDDKVVKKIYSIF